MSLSSSAESEEDESAFADKFNERFKNRVAVVRTTAEIEPAATSMLLKLVDVVEEKSKEEERQTRLEEDLLKKEADMEKLER